ncbi:MAG: hypothetical protein QM817_02545 [Archangium sp.]
MWALALTVVAALPPLTVVARPDGEVKAPLAQVVLHDGTVTLTPAGQRAFGAQRGMQLAGTDTLTVAPGAWVVVHLLGNGHVVRLDDDLVLRVDQLAALKAPKQTQTLQQQLDRLVTLKEQDSAATRLIGWNAGQSGANVPQSTGPTKTKDTGADDEGGGGNFKANAPKDMPKSSKAPESVQIGKPPPGASTPPPPPPKPGNVNNAPSPVPAPPPPSKPDPAVALVADATLQACVTKSVESLGADVLASFGDQLVLRVKLRDGAAVVQLPRGLPTPACATSWFYGKPGIGAAWTDVPVKLK